MLDYIKNGNANKTDTRLFYILWSLKLFLKSISSESSNFVKTGKV